MNEAVKNPHGGARSAAGRKPAANGGAMLKVSVSMDDLTRRKAVVLGEENLSRGIRLAVDLAYDRFQSGKVR